MQSSTASPAGQELETNVVECLSHGQLNGPKVVFKVLMSDLLLQRFGGLSEELLQTPMGRVQLRKKQPDRGLSLMERLVAPILRIDPVHEFVLAEAGDWCLSVDFYETNEVTVRLGDRNTVLYSPNRQRSEVLQENGIVPYSLVPVHSVPVGSLLRWLRERIQDNAIPPYDRVFHRGHHFSRQVWRFVLSLAG